MPEPIDQETDAIKTLLTTLQPLEPKVREAVVDYVLKRLDIKISNVQAITQPTMTIHETPAAQPHPPQKDQGQDIHIKDLKEQKRPSSAIEMATLVAYYLSHMAPLAERKEIVTTKDIETYFKIADFKPHTKLQFTLPNTKDAGYLDVAGRGKYKLNAVGYNLVVHSMPKIAQTAPLRKSPGKKSKTKRHRKK